MCFSLRFVQRRVILLTTISLFSIIFSSYGKTPTWKGFDLTRLTDAFKYDVPIGTCYLVVSEYKAKERFGKIETTGDPIATTVYEFDEAGFLTKGPKYTYINSYNTEGLIKQRDLYEGDKFYQRIMYEYFIDNKGPGVNLLIYDSNGEKDGIESWQNNTFNRMKTGIHENAKLNKKGRKIESITTITNYNQSVSMQENLTYNDHGYLEVDFGQGPGFNKIYTYSNYVYNNQGVWIERFSDGILKRRKILSKDEYENLQEQLRVEAEQKRAEQERKKLEEEARKKAIEIARKVSETKKEIKKRGFMPADVLISRPSGTVEIYETNKPYEEDFKLIIPDKPSQISLSDVMTVNINTPAQYKFHNDSIGVVPSMFIGTVRCYWAVDKKFDKPIEIKVAFDQISNVWGIKDVNKLSSKHQLSTAEIDALINYIAEIGRKKPFTSKKIYLSHITQMRVHVKSWVDSALDCNECKTFPIRFTISETKN